MSSSRELIAHLQQRAGVRTLWLGGHVERQLETAEIETIEGWIDGAYPPARVGLALRRLLGSARDRRIGIPRLGASQ
jgi:hypothetical protein